MTASETEILELIEVSKIYGDLHALDRVSLAVPPGEWLSIVGPSGSGKTTLVNIVGCLDRPTSGRVRLGGRDIGHLNPAGLTEIRRTMVGLIFQKFHLIGHLTALENVMVAQYYHSMPDQAEALAALERVGLAGRASHLPSQLSGGEQQRVCVARALINDPRLILADEPTGNLDAANEAIVLDLFHQLHDEGATLIVVTHDATVAAQGDREVTLEHGRLVRDVAPGGAGAKRTETAKTAKTAKTTGPSGTPVPTGTTETTGATGTTGPIGTTGTTKTAGAAETIGTTETAEITGTTEVIGTTGIIGTTEAGNGRGGPDGPDGEDGGDR
jgi:putative ABC transport system ATP-binding protein